ncbi:MAG: Lar family restriction alleviation protein [Deltaproteobacteria bacterium]|nr:Lar family restriction alleviation protein [Deltaproteobacteria bacterium]
MKLDIRGDGRHGWSGHGDYELGIDSALKDCPFCGEAPKNVSNTHTPSYSVECGCSAEIHGQVGDWDNLKSKEGAIEEHKKAFQSAIDAWNRRA